MAQHDDRVRYLANRSRRININGIGNFRSIYKYVSLHNKRSWNYFQKTFEDFELIGSTIDSLNDPFEGHPKFFNDLDEKKSRNAASISMLTASLVMRNPRRILSGSIMFKN